LFFYSTRRQEAFQIGPSKSKSLMSCLYCYSRAIRRALYQFESSYSTSRQKSISEHLVYKRKKDEESYLNGSILMASVKVWW